MTLVKSCCGLWELKEGARNIAIISMVYDLLAAAGLLLVLLLHVPRLPWIDPPEPTEYYKVMLIISISIRIIHLIPSFFLLYSTWEEVERGVGWWLFLAFCDVVLHGSWIPVPFVRRWPLDKSVILISLLLVGIFIIIYFIYVISSYLNWLKDRNKDLRARRRLKEYY